MLDQTLGTPPGMGHADWERSEQERPNHRNPAGPPKEQNLAPTGLESWIRLAPRMRDESQDLVPGLDRRIELGQHRAQEGWQREKDEGGDNGKGDLGPAGA